MTTDALIEPNRKAGAMILAKEPLVLAEPTLRFMDDVGNARHGVDITYDYWPEDLRGEIEEIQVLLGQHGLQFVECLVQVHHQQMQAVALVANPTGYVADVLPGQGVVDDVVEAVDSLGISRRVAKMIPIGNIKG